MPDFDCLFSGVGDAVTQRNALHGAFGTGARFHQVGFAESYRFLGRE